MKEKTPDLVKGNKDATFSQANRLVLVGSSLTIAGLVLCLTVARIWAGWLFLSGIILAIAGLHKYGRSGPSPFLLSGTPVSSGSSISSSSPASSSTPTSNGTTTTPP